jgi:hypothetical protein
MHSMPRFRKALERHMSWAMSSILGPLDTGPRGSPRSVAVFIQSLRAAPRTGGEAGGDRREPGSTIRNHHTSRIVAFLPRGQAPY